MTRKVLFIFLLTTILFSKGMIAYAMTGTIDATYHYAWSENLGWINFYAQGGNVTVSDEKISGYAWSEGTGWINLAPTATTYVHNDAHGNLSGFAWGEGTGYIDFSGVTIDNDGYFHGFAHSDATGAISFNCDNSSSCNQSHFKVRTLWRVSGTTETPQITANVSNYSGSVLPSPALFLTPQLTEDVQDVKQEKKASALAAVQAAVSKTVPVVLGNTCTGVCLWKGIAVAVAIVVLPIYISYKIGKRRRKRKKLLY